MRIGILQTGHAPEKMPEHAHHYDTIFQTMLAGHDFDFVDYFVVDNEFPESADVADGWLITGSKHGAYEDHPWIPPLERLIREINRSGIPLIGVCFGHQIIAQALGGKVEKYSGGWTVGATSYQVGDDMLTLNAWHQDQVTGLPDHARVLGSSAFCNNAVLAYGDTVWTIQPHPEFSNDFVGELIRHYGPCEVPDDLLQRAADRLDSPNDNSKVAAWVAEFFKKSRT